MPAPTPATPATPFAPRSDSELSEFLLRACHDLRGPLRTVRTHAELLARNNAAALGDDSKQSLAFMIGGSATAGAVLDGITDYALALAIDPSRFNPVPLDVIVRGALARLSEQIRASGAEVSYSELPSVPGDADRLLQLFEYLVDCAVRGGPNRPRISITAELQDGAWVFTVVDNAGGINPEPLEAVFKPFTRVQGNQRPGPGLAICRVIVERHGGRIWAESAPGGGCVFGFTLPLE
jgi:light-regulated signal transduction histidine kinase (bacteriophytochrome)